MAKVVSGSVVSKVIEVPPSIPTLSPFQSSVSNNTKPALGGTGAAGSYITIMDGTKVNVVSYAGGNMFPRAEYLERTAKEGAIRLNKK